MADMPGMRWGCGVSVASIDTAGSGHFVTSRARAVVVLSQKQVSHLSHVSLSFCGKGTHGTDRTHKKWVRQLYACARVREHPILWRIQQNGATIGKFGGPKFSYGASKFLNGAWLQCALTRRGLESMYASDLRWSHVASDQFQRYIVFWNYAKKMGKTCK